jgi:hypothetical protein
MVSQGLSLFQAFHAFQVNELIPLLPTVCGGGGGARWASCDYVRTLPPLESLDVAYRYDSEGWVAKGQDWRPRGCLQLLRDSLRTHGTWIREEDYRGVPCSHDGGTVAAVA